MTRISVVVGLAVLGVACNKPPEGGVVSITPQAPQTLDALTLSVDEDAVDPNGHTITYDITWTRNGVEEPSVAGATQVPAELTARGEVWEATVTPIDEKDEPGPSLTASTTILNTAPTASVEVETPDARTGEALMASATSADDDGDQVDVSWVWTRDGSATEYRSDSVPEGVTARGEVWIAQVTPNDGTDDGEVGEASITIDNALPVAVRVDLSPVPPSKAASVTATPTGYDDDGDTISWTYTWLVNGVALPDIDGPVLTAESFDKGATLAVEAVPNDGFVDGAAVTSDELVVANTPPTAESATISPAEIRAGINASCDLGGWNDLDGDPEGFSVTWTVNGREVGTGETLLASEFGRDDVLQCTVIPDDGTDEGAPVSSATVTVENTAPVLGGITLSPTSPQEADTVSVSLSGAVDADGDRISYRYAWEVAGTSIGSTAATLTGSDFSKGQSIVAIVTPSDGDADGAPVRSSAITVANTPPVVTSVTLSPTTLYSTTPVTASVSATDADGDRLSYTYAWFVQDEGSGSFRTQSETGSTLAASNYDKDDVVYVEVTALDGDDSSAAVASGRLTIQNLAPPAPSAVALSPSSPTATNNLTCSTASVSDPDGDSIRYRYQWLKNGSVDLTVVSSARSNLLAASRTAGGERWQCRVSSFDGTAYSATRSSTTVTIRGTASTWTFTDGTGDDIAATSLRDFYNGLGTVPSSSYIFVDINGSTSGVNFGAWCSQRADWYVNNYKAKASASSSENSGTWTKWHRSSTGSWSSGETTARRNYWGSSCDSNAWSWCSEWGIGGRYLGIMPGNATSGESYVTGFSGGRGWRTTVKIGTSRRDACGF